MPYDGVHLYPIGTLLELLKAGVITHENCSWGVPATRSSDPRVLKTAATALRDCVTEVAWGHTGLLRDLYPETEQRELAIDDVKFQPPSHGACGAEAAEYIHLKSDELRVGRQNKGTVLEMLGIWIKDVQRQHVVHQTWFEEDMNSEALHASWNLDSETPTMILTYELLDNRT